MTGCFARGVAAGVGSTLLVVVGLAVLIAWWVLTHEQDRYTVVVDGAEVGHGD